MSLFVVLALFGFRLIRGAAARWDPLGFCLLRNVALLLRVRP